MGSVFEFVIYGMATWRVSSLLVSEKGPWNVFLRLREWTGIEHDANGRHTIIPDGFLAGALSCVWCASVWVGLGWMGFSILFPHWSFPLASAFALSAAAVMLEAWIRNR